VVQVPPVQSLRERLYQLYGERDDLVEIRRDGDVRVLGYIAALAEQGPSGSALSGPTRGPQNVFVNRRVVKDRTIAHAIIDAYSVASIKERSPEVHLFIEMPREAVDVNVHPTKAEVRFRDQSYIHQVIRRALGDALGRGPAPAFALVPSRPIVPEPSPLPLPASYGTTFPSRWAAPAAPAAGGGFGAASGEPMAANAEASIAPAGMHPMIPLGQFRDTFIIAVDDEGIAVIDQHVAHERVLFERVMQRLTTGRLESQRLLEPLVVELSAAACDLLIAREAELDRFGFEVSSFGGRSLRVAAVPALLTPDESVAALRALAEDLEGLDQGAKVGEALKRIAALTACHAAVKANCPLTHEKMLHILDELRQTAYSSICPHGRPVMLRLTRREIEKNFQRI
jgi:DNA mismatch repair protein MutL